MYTIIQCIIQYNYYVPAFYYLPNRYLNVVLSTVVHSCMYNIRLRCFVYYINNIYAVVPSVICSGTQVHSLRTTGIYWYMYIVVTCRYIEYTYTSGVNIYIYINTYTLRAWDNRLCSVRIELPKSTRPRSTLIIYIYI